MDGCLTIENISDAEFDQLKDEGWVLISVDNFYDDKNFVFKFRKN